MKQARLGPSACTLLSHIPRQPIGKESWAPESNGLTFLCCNTTIVGIPRQDKGYTDISH